MKVLAMTYNMSWATQKNVPAGSEKDFVEQCRRSYKKGGKQCTENAIQNIGKVGTISLLGIQEVNSKIESKIKKVQPTLKKYERGQLLKSDGNIVTITIMWDPLIFGNVTDKYSFNLKNKKDPRPCLVLLTDKNFVLINLHSTWETKLLHKTLSSKLSKHANIRKALEDESTKVIVLGDFNDDTMVITKKKPLTITLRKKKVRVRHTKTKGQLHKDLRSCCWHEPGHPWKYFTNVGDYVLTNKNVIQKSLYIPGIFKKAGRNNRLFSDHKPVMSHLIL